MKKFYFALISDVLFFTLCAFLISFAAIRFFIKSIALTTVIALSVAAAVCLITLFLLTKRRERLIATTAAEGEIKQLAIHLTTLPQEEVILLFLNALSGTYAAGNRLEDEQNEYGFAFKIAPLTCDDIAIFARGRGGKNAVLMCCTLTPEAANFAADLNVKTTCIGDIYKLLKEKELLPSKYAYETSAKKSTVKKIKKRFNRRLCPSLFFSGFFLLLYSFFSFYPIWYVVTGSILTVLSATCLFINDSGN